MSDPSPGPSRAATVRNFVLAALALAAVVSIGLFVKQTFGPTPPPPPGAPAEAPGTTPNATAAATPPPATQGQPTQTNAPPGATASTSTPTAPAPTGSMPAGPAPASPSFDIVRIDPQGGAVIAGRGMPGAEVTILSDGAEIGQATTDGQGAWALTLTTPLPPGPHALTLHERTAAGQTLASEGSVLMAVPLPSPTAPLPPLAVLTAPRQAPRLLQGPPGEGTAKPGQLGLGALDYDTHGDLTMSGTAAPNSTVRLYSDNRLIGEVHTDKEGRWSLTPGAVPPAAPGTTSAATQGTAASTAAGATSPTAPTTPVGTAIAEGTHQLRLDQVGPSGKVTGRVELPFRRELVPPGELATGRVIVQPGNSLWRLAYHAYGQGLRYTVIFRANQDQIRNPNLIYPGQVFSVPAAAPTGSDGTVSPVSSSTSR
jgi:hypothetical protein